MKRAPKTTARAVATHIERLSNQSNVFPYTMTYMNEHIMMLKITTLPNFENVMGKWRVG